MPLAPPPSPRRNDAGDESSSSSASDSGDVVIAVLGMTGAGKSTLIQQLSGQKIKVGDGGLEAATQKVQPYTVIHQGRKLTLIDTPGLDDDSNALSDIFAFVAENYGKDFELSGVIYLHPINVPRVSSSVIHGIRAIPRLLLAPITVPRPPKLNLNVVIASTRWASVSQEVGEQRESYLRNDVWKPLIDNHAAVTTYTGEARSAWNVLESLAPFKAGNKIQPLRKSESERLAEARESRETQEREKREIRERERKRNERSGVKLQEWLREWGGYDVKPGRRQEQQQQRPRYDPPKHIRSNLARLADDLFPPSTSTAASGGGFPVQGKGKERRRGSTGREPVHGVPPELFEKPDRGFDCLTTLVDRVSGLAKKVEGQGELARNLRQQSVQTQKVNDVLFKDKQLLQMSTPVFDQLSPIGQKILAAAAESSMDALLGTLSQAASGSGSGNTGSGPIPLEKTLGTALATVQTANEAVKGHLRQYLLESNAFNHPDVLEHVSQLKGGPAVDLGLVADAKMRARNVEKRPDLFQADGSGGVVPKGQPCSTCGAEDDDEVMEVRSGQVDESANDDFLKFPGRLNSIPIRALIDTGGGCNLINAKWVETQKIKPDPSRSESLVMADGSSSKSCDVVKVKWSFDDRKILWDDVEFIVVEGHDFDALIGLPFLKHTEIIHNKAGKLVFPEFKGVHTKRKGIPLFHFNKLKPSK